VWRGTAEKSLITFKNSMFEVFLIVDCNVGGGRVIVLGEDFYLCERSVYFPCEIINRFENFALILLPTLLLEEPLPL
jgi:hypothetical protein